MTQLIGKVLESYQEIGGINNIDGSNLPSKRAIAQICEDFLQLMFPGFHDEEPIATEQLGEITRIAFERQFREILEDTMIVPSRCESLMFSIGNQFRDPELTEWADASNRSIHS